MKSLSLLCYIMHVNVKLVGTPSRINRKLCVYVGTCQREHFQAIGIELLGGVVNVFPKVNHFMQTQSSWKLISLEIGGKLWAVHRRDGLCRKRTCSWQDCNKIRSVGRKLVLRISEEHFADCLLYFNDLLFIFLRGFWFMPRRCNLDLDLTGICTYVPA